MKFLLFYPIFMSLIWIIFSIVFSLKSLVQKKSKVTNWPAITILIPCYNEEKTIGDTVTQLIQKIEYPLFEIILIDDGSVDSTLHSIMVLSHQYKEVRVCGITTNLGKAHALTQGAICSNSEYLLCLDADATIEKETIKKMVCHFLGKQNHDVGAVTGNPIVKNREKFIAKIQTVEFLSIIGLIKRAHSLFGTLNTVSGVCVMYRKEALLEVGWWDQECITEDISVTWRLQRNHWRTLFEPEAICWMLVPERVSSLIKQRLRWSQGSVEVLLKNVAVLYGKTFHFSLSVLFIDQFISIIWSLVWYSFLPIVVIEMAIFSNFEFVIVILASFITALSLLQYIVSLLINFSYDQSLFKTSLNAIWYVFLYWIINPLTLLIAIPLGIKTHLKGGQATWESPEREGLYK